MQPAFFPPKGARPMSDSVLEAPARPELANYVGGEWKPARSGRTYEKRNPANPAEIVGEFPASGEEDVDAAVEAAAQAFPGWSGLPAAGRAAVLMRAADAIEARVEEMAADMTREMGKPLREARMESARTAAIFRYFAGEAGRPKGELYEQSATGATLYTLRRPLGVVGLITPWNFPSAIPAWKMAPALVAGNAVVLKPASLAPLSAYRLVEVLHEAGIPAGAVNYLTGSGGAVGNAMIEHSALRAVSFTGSCEVGNKLQEKMNGRKVRIQLEMGGKNPTVVLKDADLDYAADVLVNGAFFSTGQKCTACSRAVIEKAVYEPLVEKLVAKTRKLKVGNGLEPGVDIGPAVDANQLETDLKYIEIGKKEGAELLCGGKRLAGGAYDKGYFIEPTIFASVAPEMRIAQEEVFGPVLALMVANDFDDAMRLAKIGRAHV